jgi:hypothetical protein
MQLYIIRFKGELNMAAKQFLPRILKMKEAYNMRRNHTLAELVKYTLGEIKEEIETGNPSLKTFIGIIRQNNEEAGGKIEGVRDLRALIVEVFEYAYIKGDIEHKDPK